MIDSRNDNRWTVYIHIVPKSVSGYNHDKYYIGITGRIPKERWGHNGNGYREYVFGNAIKKYGWDNIEHYIVCENLTKDEAEKMEISLIKILDSTNKEIGYNRTLGGTGGSQQNSKPVCLYDFDGNYINIFPSAAEVLRYLSNIEGEKIHRNHICEACRRKGGTVYHKKYRCYYACDFNEIKAPKYRRSYQYDIYQFDFNGNFIKKYNSPDEACKENNIPSSSHILGDRIYAYGYIWKTENQIIIDEFGNPTLIPDNICMTDLDDNIIEYFKYITEPYAKYNYDIKAIIQGVKLGYKAYGYKWKYVNDNERASNSSYFIA